MTCSSAGKAGPVRLDPLPARGVGDQQPGARIGEAIFELGPGPPGVERDRDRAERGDGEEGDRPFGQVDHRDRDPVALADAEPPKLGGRARRWRDIAPPRTTRSSSKMVAVRSPWARDSRTREGRLGGAFFQTRVGMPRMTASSISSREPGAVSSASTSARLIRGQSGSSSKPSITRLSFRSERYR